MTESCIFIFEDCRISQWLDGTTTQWFAYVYVVQIKVAGEHCTPLPTPLKPAFDACSLDKNSLPSFSRANKGEIEECFLLDHSLEQIFLGGSAPPKKIAPHGKKDTAVRGGFGGRGGAKEIKGPPPLPQFTICIWEIEERAFGIGAWVEEKDWGVAWELAREIGTWDWRPKR